MNALKSHDEGNRGCGGTESEIPARQVVVSDVVLIAAGDEVPADGRIVAASALQIDESALWESGKRVARRRTAAAAAPGQGAP
jgi:Ca2+-transporting ATPase